MATNLAKSSMLRSVTNAVQYRFIFQTSKSTEEAADKSKEEGGQGEANEQTEKEKLLEAKLVEMEEKSADLLDKYRRSLADFENLRNRMNKQVADAKVFGIQGFCKVFERHGLKQDNPLGEKFDPNRHDALFQVPMPDKEPNTVIDVQKVGYILQGRTIRPAAVGVSRK